MMSRYIFALLIFISSSAIAQNKKLTITRLTKDFYIYTTWGDAGNGNMFPANSMYLVTEKGVVLFDTPWDTTQFQPLLDSIMAKHRKKVIMCLSTHFHEDRTAGLNYYRQKGIKTYTTKQTDDLSKQHHKPRAESLIYRDTTFHMGQYTFETYYPGKGHSPDNIVIWFPKEQVLYGGCFIKSTETNSVGNLSDANIDEWIKSAEKVQAKFKAPKYIIPGHQDWHSRQSLAHTLTILKKYKEENSN